MHFNINAVILLISLHLSGSIGSRFVTPPGGNSRLTLSPSDKIVTRFEGDNYVVSCLNGGSDTVWYSPAGTRANVTKISRVRQQLRRGGGGFNLFLTDIALNDAGTYRCSSRGNNLSFNLVVIRRIRFDETLAYQSTSENSNYIVKCFASGQSKSPKLYWKVDGRSPKSPKYRVVKEGLLIANVTREDAKKEYVCHAMDVDSPIPDSKRMTIQLHVTRKPTPLDKSVIKETWAVIGQRVNLTCRIDADPLPSFEWFSPKNERLTLGDHFSIVNEIKLSEYSSTLQVLLRSDDMFGQYKCRVANDMGEMEKIFHVKRGRKPSTPFLELDSIDGHSVRVKVQRYKPLPSEIPDLPIVAYLVEYKLKQDAVWFTARFSTYEKGFQLLGLLPGTTYHVRAALKNAAAVGDFSQPITISTESSTKSSSSTEKKLDNLKDNKVASSRQISRLEPNSSSQETSQPSRTNKDSPPTNRYTSMLEKRNKQTSTTPSPTKSYERKAFKVPKDLFVTPSSTKRYKGLMPNRNKFHNRKTEDKSDENSFEAAETKITHISTPRPGRYFQKGVSAEEPMVKRSNETSVITTTTNNETVTTTSNIVSIITRTISVLGRVKIITTKKEEILTERIESNNEL